jgi:hypothetical protein
MLVVQSSHAVSHLVFCGPLPVDILAGVPDGLHQKRSELEIHTTAPNVAYRLVAPGV